MCITIIIEFQFYYISLPLSNTLSPTFNLKSPGNFRKIADREVPVFATFVKSLSLAALRNYLSSGV